MLLFLFFFLLLPIYFTYIFGVPMITLSVCVPSCPIRCHKAGSFGCESFEIIKAALYSTVARGRFLRVDLHVMPCCLERGFHQPTQRY